VQLLVYILVYPILWVISVLPFRILYLFSDFLFIILYKIAGYRTKTVNENLRLVFPNKSEKEIREIRARFYHHLCDMIVEAIKSMTISPEELKKRFKFKNIDLIKDLESKNRSIVLMVGHYGSWEWIFALQLYVKYSGYAVYKRLRNRYFDRLVKRIRARHNSYLITTKETFSVIKRVEKDGELAIYGFAADQSPRLRKGLYWNKFMGTEVPMHTGAEVLAKRYDLAVIFMHVNRLKRGFYESEFQVITEDPNSLADFSITDKFFKLVEAEIYKNPAYYLWTHKRWKHKDKNTETLN
jgi:KDO2-lipid IV(A) lauroyltransferase